MHKRIIVGVACATDDADSRPETFTVTVSDKLKARIKELSDAVALADAYRIEEFNFEGIWSGYQLDTDFLEDEGVNHAIERLNGKALSVECNLLMVSKEHFRWSSVPKHCGDDLLLTTRKIPISFLDGAEDLFVELT